jgi:DNA invertase Pin-like site-specific DNA recombinase
MNTNQISQTIPSDSTYAKTELLMLEMKSALIEAERKLEKARMCLNLLQIIQSK